MTVKKMKRGPWKLQSIMLLVTCICLGVFGVKLDHALALNSSTGAASTGNIDVDSRIDGQQRTADAMKLGSRESRVIAITSNSMANRNMVNQNTDGFGNVRRVLIIGSSVAAGWKDNRVDGGYLHRAFRAISDISNNRFDVYDKAIPGEGVESIKDKYENWLDTIQPNIVVVAWGGLDDLHDKTPLSEFDAQVKWEITLALAHDARVFVVTSPISRASYTTYKVAQQQLFNNEMATAESFNSPDVYVFNIFDQMKAYLRNHDETYVPYMGDGWHPNAAGHELAAQLLVNDWSQRFGSATIKPYFGKKV